MSEHHIPADPALSVHPGIAEIPPNARRLLHHLITNGPTHRADLARALDVSRTTITNLTTSLREERLVEILGTDKNGLKLPLATTPHLGTLVSLAFFVDTCALAVATLDGRITTEATLAISPSLDARARLDAAIELIRSTYRKLELEPSSLRGIHLALDTQVNTRTGDIHAAQASARWYGVNPRKYLSDAFPVPIALENSIRLSGLAEALWGAGKDYRDVLYLSVRRGATSAHIQNRHIIAGAHGGAGEFGHVVYQWGGPACACGNRGCAMQYMCIPALLDHYQQHVGEAIEWNTFLERARRGDQVVTELAAEAAIVCARTLLNIAHVIDPGIVIINCAGVARLPHFIEQVGNYVAQHALPLVGRHLQVIGSALPDVVEATARAGIYALRHNRQIQAAVGAAQENDLSHSHR